MTKATFSSYLMLRRDRKLARASLHEDLKITYILKLC